MSDVRQQSTPDTRPGAVPNPPSGPVVPGLPHGWRIDAGHGPAPHLPVGSIPAAHLPPEALQQLEVSEQSAEPLIDAVFDTTQEQRDPAAPARPIASQNSGSVDNEQALLEFADPNHVPPDAQLLRQTQQLAELLQHRTADLDRREQRLYAQLAELDQERRQARLLLNEAAAEYHGREAELQRREDLCAQREQSLLQLDQELHLRRAELQQHEHELQALETDRLSHWDQLQAEFEHACEQRRIELDNAAVTHSQQQERDRHQLQQDRILWQNRIRFQENHLQNSRDEFEAEQTAWRFEQQQLQTLRVADEEQQRLRRWQLDTYRQWLHAWEQSLEREQGLLARLQTVERDEFQRERERLAAEQAEWSELRQRQATEWQQRVDQLRQNAEQLEARQQRLDQIRAELDETNRRTLEMRLAVEEACAQLAQAVGPEQARQRIEAARSELSEYLRFARESLQQERREFEQMQRDFDRQRTEFRSEQQTLTEWFSLRDQELRVREVNSQAAWATFAQREQAWQQTRDRWLREKLAAEAVIRDLLRQSDPQQTSSK